LLGHGSVERSFVALRIVSEAWLYGARNLMFGRRTAGSSPGFQPDSERQNEWAVFGFPGLRSVDLDFFITAFFHHWAGSAVLRASSSGWPVRGAL
jgi:hypothetical protein